MWSKIYLIILAAAILTMSFLLYFSYSWLQSIDAPTTVRDNYLYYSNISQMFLFVSALALLIAGNVVLWTTRKAWAVWTALLYFAGFTIANSFWLENSFFRYKQTNHLDSGLVSWSPVFGVILIVLATIIVFFNQYLVKRMQDKIYAVDTTDEQMMLEENSRLDDADSSKSEL